MYNIVKNLILIVAIFSYIADSCLITNCPRGGKRSGNNMSENRRSGDIKQCISCGPQLSGRCFGPGICCGPFGCLIKTIDTLRCQHSGGFNEQTPCIAGKSTCEGNAGRCALNGVCCSQDSCFKDISCNDDTDNEALQLEGIFNFLNPYQRTIQKDILEKI